MFPFRKKQNAFINKPMSLQVNIVKNKCLQYYYFCQNQHKIG